MTLILRLNFYLKVFCLLFIHFANLWQRAELPNSKSDAWKHGYLGLMPSTGYGGPVQSFLR